MKFDNFFKVFLSLLLAIIGFFLMQTFLTIKGLEKDIITIREKLSALEATKMTRKEIREMIRDYHDNHPFTQYLNFQKEKKKKDEEE